MPTPSQLFGPAPTTREGWADALLALAAPATRTAAAGPGRMPVHASMSDHRAVWFELVARPLWGLAAHAAGGLSGADRQWEETRHALTSAVDPEHPWYVGSPADMDQRLVESAAVGYALAVARHQLWDPLTERQRQQLADWLSAAASATPWDNNWCFFPVLAAVGLRSVGVPVDETRTAAHLDRIEDFALNGGWYADGPGTSERPGSRDYYVPFGFHFYGLLLASLKAVDEERSRRYRQRAAEFATQFQHWFAADGAALPFGRSLGYRFAQGAFWSALAAADQPAVGWSTARSLAQGNLAWWWQRPVLAEDGSLTVGYAYPNTGVVEQYLAGGSPYWGTKVFASLAATEDHPFWTATPAPVPPPGTSRQPAAAMILARDTAGDVVALAGQNAPAWNPRGGTAKYAKFAYSTLAAFSVPTGEPTLEQGGFDSALALSDDGEGWRTRSGGESRIEGETLVVRWQPWPDVTVETRLRHTDGGHLREHRIITGRRLYTAEGAFCVPKTGLGAIPHNFTEHPGLARATADTAVSEIVCLSADTSPREGVVVLPLPGSHLLHPRTALPTLRGVLDPGEHVLRCRVSLTRR
ncbi:DUF2264 domain-containing protein [Streptomyces sp. NBC_01356]|uniref:DUF2264 domain-containing protein n=1 Tax=Streptomyces sp. NBC_01356 TaxID=2903836 RepID=UPI002E381CF6|nr:DUF2264 domain-containing protein [Streptomyces sp. NBC_01356]